MRAKYLLAALLAGCCSVSANATTWIDPIGDFAPGYSGAASDLDVTSFSVSYNAASQLFTLGATMAGVINPSTAGVYIIGVNTGTGVNAPFAAQGAPNVRFNQTIRVNKDGTATIGATPLTATLVGNLFTLTVANSLLTSTGFTPENYGWNLWPRTGVGAGTLITDFAPDNGLISASGVPEPATWGMLVGGFGLLGAALRRRRSSFAAG